MNAIEPQQVVVSVATDGTVTAHTVGIKGSACVDSIGVLEDLLDAATVSSEFTREYTQSSVTADTVVEVDDDVRQY
ncbi:DUF2997 domain-containing protein [Xylanimonas allomyrinae]|uniref:DUF2997 domain-containing protein n=1 Tax=Xylanimonas allomyrinae TaxID=2509459 RepID=A0A4V0YE71_9MICO|nr:DUF2997 domain-containing protein [Xylanimonas allomyrinae]QAY63191.1 DUF2997 domain-containing protein [Xylanimonas allomyrinae]